jgi:hypothetical protein
MQPIITVVPSATLLATTTWAISDAAAEPNHRSWAAATLPAAEPAAVHQHGKNMTVTRWLPRRRSCCRCCSASPCCTRD